MWDGHEMVTWPSHLPKINQGKPEIRVEVFSYSLNPLLISSLMNVNSTRHCNICDISNKAGYRVRTQISLDWMNEIFFQYNNYYYNIIFTTIRYKLFTWMTLARCDWDHTTTFGMVQPYSQSFSAHRYATKPQGTKLGMICSPEYPWERGQGVFHCKRSKAV